MIQNGNILKFYLLSHFFWSFVFRPGDEEANFIERKTQI